MAVVIERPLLERLELGVALNAERDYAPPYLPVSALIQALQGHEAEATAVLEGAYRSGFEVEAAQIIYVAKKGGGLRPVAATDFGSRVLYRALTNRIEPALPDLDRSFENKRELERAPLEDAGHQYVVLADVAAFYDMIDHGRLVQEVVAQTGDAEVSETLARFLRDLMGRDFGLPQVLHPSDVLSETYIDIAERALLRRGLAVTRFNDDFWIGAPTWIDANAALESLNEEIRNIGLTLNEVKTLPIRRDHYEDWLAEPENRWAAINESVEIDLRDVGYVDGEEEMPEQPDDQTLLVVEAAERALEIALEEEVADRLQAEVNRQLIGAAISAFDFLSAPHGVPYVERILSREPHLTARVARYLGRLSAGEAEHIASTIEAAVVSEGTYLSDWQAAWLFEPLRRLPELSIALQQWVENHLAETHADLARARAALVLGEKRLIGSEALAELYGTVASAARPDVVSAIARALTADDRLVRSVAREHPFNRWIVEAAAP